MVVYVIWCPHRTWRRNHSNRSNSTKTRPNRLQCCRGADPSHLQRYILSDEQDNRADAFASRCRTRSCTRSTGPTVTMCSTLPILHMGIHHTVAFQLPNVPDMHDCQPCRRYNHAYVLVSHCRM